MWSLLRIAMQKHRRLLVVLISLTLVLTVCMPIALGNSSSASASDWTMFRQDPSHSGLANENNSANSAKVLWNYTTGRMVQSSPAVVSGYVCVGSRDGQVYCLNASSGEPIWIRTIKSEVWSSPAIYNGYVYFGADDGNVYCLNVTTGSPIWKSPIGGPVRSSPTVADGTIYIGSGKQNVYALNASDGTQIWSFPTATPVSESPAFSSGVVYVASGDDFMYAINGSTGSEMWSHHIRSSVSSPAVCNVYVYVGSYDGYIYGLNASSGAQIWKYQTADEVDSCPAVAYGCVYVGSEDNSVYCLNSSDGHKIWQSATGFWVTSSPAVAGGSVYVGSEDNNIYSLNASTGAKEWSYQTGNYVESSPAIANNTLYVGSDDSHIYALALYNSTVQPQLPQSNPTLPWTTIAFDTIACLIGAVTVFVGARYVYSTKRLKRSVESINVSGQKHSWLKSHVNAIFVLVILALSILLFFVNLGNGVLQTADEQTYVQWAVHMVRTGDYLTPWAYGEVSFLIGKPPLLMWLMSLTYQIFGINNFASRIWTAAFGTLSLVLVFYLGKKLYNSYVGFMSALILGTFLTFSEFARLAMTDVPLVFFLSASIYFFVLSEKTENDTRYAVLSGVFFGLALMTKQIAALLIPLIIITYLLATKRTLIFTFAKRCLLFLGVGLLIFSPWLIYMSIRFGSVFSQWYFGYSDFSRTLSPLEGHAAGYLYYFSYLRYNENPLWLTLLPFSAGLCVFNAVVKRLKEDTLIFLWMAIVLLVFTFAQTKIYWYILPAFPAFAIAISSFLYQLSNKIYQAGEKAANKQENNP